jgi:serpin B
MMSIKKETFWYFAGDDYQWLELPYDKGDRLTMLVALPRRAGRLADLEKQLTPATLQKAVENLEPREGAVSLPRFKMTCQYSLGEDLEALGMPLAFSASANFNGIAHGKGLRISEVAHMAFIEVDEVGTEAAAATAVFMTLGRPPPPFAFVANHPFLFFLRDRATGCILFQGRVTDPNG